AGRVGRSADLRVLGAAQLEDLRDGRDRLDVVDQRRRRVKAGDGRERRPRAGLASLALERLEHAGFLAADVGAGTAVENDRNAAQEIRVAHFVEGRAQGLERVEILAADVDEDVLRVDRGWGGRSER